MLARQILKSGSPVAQLIQRRGHSVVSGPPQVKVSFGEKIAHGSIMMAGWLAIPVWVLVNLKEYKGQK